MYYAHLYLYLPVGHHSQFHPAGQRIRFRHLCNDVLSVLPSHLWRVGHAFRSVVGQYGTDGSPSKLEVHPLAVNGVHYQRFGEGLRLTTDRLDSKNFYAFNPSFDKKCK